jgi:hypothetical protein
MQNKELSETAGDEHLLFLYAAGMSNGFQSQNADGKIGASGT